MHSMAASLSGNLAVDVMQQRRVSDVSSLVASEFPWLIDCHPNYIKQGAVHAQIVSLKLSTLFWS